MKAEALFEQAQDLRDQENFERALESYHQAREAAIQEKNGWVVSESIHMSGLVNQHLKRYQQASEDFITAQNDFKQAGDEVMVGAVLRDRALLALEQEALENAQHLIKLSIDYLSKTDRFGHLGMSQVKFGNILAKLDKLAEAEDKIKEGVINIEKSDDRFFESSAYYDLAKLQKMVGKKDQAIESAKKSLQILDQIASADQHLKRKEQILKFIQDLETNPQ